MQRLLGSRMSDMSERVVEMFIFFSSVLLFLAYVFAVLFLLPLEGGGLFEGYSYPYANCCTLSFESPRFLKICLV